MNSRRKWLLLLLVLIAMTISACARYSLNPFDPALHGTAAEEWAPHDDVSEWWYVTGQLRDEEEKQYFYQLTIFHAFVGDQAGYILHLALTDFSTGRHYFRETPALPGPRVHGDSREIVFLDCRFELSLDAVGNAQELRFVGAHDRDFSFDLRAIPAKPVVWHGEDGIIIMGHPEDPSERSFYYSYTSLLTEGRFTIGGRELEVTGQSWFDRQWGKFDELGWDWFSLRLDDGREYMLFSFPSTGYQAGTLIDAGGLATAAPGFTCQVTGEMSITGKNGREYLLGWRIELADGQVFRLMPLQADQYNRTFLTPDYWEGLCRVTDGDGSFLGYAVVETTKGAQD